jgi:hypothetical protein
LSTSCVSLCPASSVAVAFEVASPFGVNDFHDIQAAAQTLGIDAQAVGITSLDGRCIVTRNRDDFIAETLAAFEAQTPHAGMLVLTQSLPNDQFSAIAAALCAHAVRVTNGLEIYTIDFLRPADPPDPGRSYIPVYTPMTSRIYIVPGTTRLWRAPTVEATGKESSRGAADIAPPLYSRRTDPIGRLQGGGGGGSVHRNAE